MEIKIISPRGVLTAAPKSFFLLLVAVSIIVSGCATPARIDQMTITSHDALVYNGSTPLKDSISVNKVSGGQGTNPLWTSEIGNDEFKEALIDSLRAAKLLSLGANQLYVLNAEMISVDQPLLGFSFTVTATIEYTLTRISDGERIFSKLISSPYTVTVGDAFLAIERLKLANEGAARENIKELIDNLYQFKISPTDVSMSR